MDLTARAAVLQALGRPRSGQEIARLLASRSHGQVRLHYGSLYPTLRRLEVDRLVRSWIERVGGRGRPRRNYELTIAGVAEAQRVRENLRSLIAPPPPVSRSRTPRQMAAGIRGCEAISLLARGLREAGGAWMRGRKREASDPSFRESAVLVARILGPESCVLVGGLAVAAHGHERATKDVDFITRLSLADAKARLVAHGLSVEVRRGDRDEGVPTFLRTTVAGIPVDVLPMLVDIDWARLPDVPLTHDASIKVVDLDTLLLLKARAGGMQDMLDVAQLVWRNLDRLPLARELAGRYDVRPKLEACLADRRERQKFVEGLPREKRRRPEDALRRALAATDN